MPSISYDGLTLIFATHRDGGGSADLWIATRDSRESGWNTCEPLPRTINTSAHEGTPFLTPDARVLIFRRSQGGRGALWATVRNSVASEWSLPMMLALPFNSGANDDSMMLSSDGMSAVLASVRPDGLGIYDLWSMRLVPKASRSDSLTREQPVNFALQFDGRDDYVATPVHFDVTGPLTVEAFITVAHKPESNQVALCDANLGGFGLGPRENGKWRMDIQALGVRGIERDEVGYVRIESDDAIEYGRRTHVAAVYDGRIVRLYVDGRSQSRPRAVENLVPSTLPIFIGANPKEDVSTAENMLGTIDEVHISNVARYTTDFTPGERHEPDKNTLALYHFDEGDGDVLIDSSGNERHGAIHGARWVRVGQSVGADDESQIPPAPPTAERRD